MRNVSNRLRYRMALLAYRGRIEFPRILPQTHIIESLVVFHLGED